MIEEKARAEHRLAFVETFRRWGLIFGRRDRNEDDDEWLVAEYYSSLSHLSVEGFRELTQALKRTVTWFPTIMECLSIIEHDSYNNIFVYRKERMFLNPPKPGLDQIGSDAWWTAALTDARAARQLEDRSGDNWGEDDG